MITAGSNTLGTLPPNVNLVKYSVNWSMVEPTRGHFDWSWVTNVENQLPPHAKLQLIIATGPYGAPTSSNTCNRWGANDRACTPWLSGVSGIPVYSDDGINGADHGYKRCTPLYAPNPADPAYQHAYEGLIDAIRARFGSDSNISMISVSPMSSVGLNLSLSQSDNCGGSQHNQVEYYNSAWSNISGCNHNESCWVAYVEHAFRTLWNYEVDNLPNQNIALWVVSFPFPDISQSSGSDANLRDLLFTYAQNNQPRGNGAYLLLNEALQDSNSWWKAVQTWAPYVGGLGGQMNRSYARQCNDLKTAIEKYGVPYGMSFVQIYGHDFDSCSSTIQTIISDERW
jgi:hypothetical protein